MRRVFTNLLLTSLVLSACLSKENIDEITIPIVAGYDKAKENQFRYTIAAPMYRADQSVSNIIHSSVSPTSQKNKEILRTEITKPFLSGKLSVLLYGSDLAREGVRPVLDTILRDPRVSRRIYLAVVDGTVKEMLDSNFSSNEEKGIYLYKLIESNIREGYLPKTNLHQFEYSLLGKGMDPFLPFLKMTERNVRIAGLALFKNDKFAVLIDMEQLQIFQLLIEDVDHGNYQVILDKNTYASVGNKHSTVTYSLSGSAQKPTVTIKLAMEGVISEYTGFNLKAKDHYRIEKALEQQITHRARTLLQTLQKGKIDPLGIGDFVRSKTRNWKEDNWDKRYPHIPIQLRVSVDILDSGAVE